MSSSNLLLFLSPLIIKFCAYYGVQCPGTPFHLLAIIHNFLFMHVPYVLSYWSVYFHVILW